MILRLTLLVQEGLPLRSTGVHVVAYDKNYYSTCGGF